MRVFEGLLRIYVQEHLRASGRENCETVKEIYILNLLILHSFNHFRKGSLSKRVLTAVNPFATGHFNSSRPLPRA